MYLVNYLYLQKKKHSNENTQRPSVSFVEAVASYSIKKKQKQIKFVSVSFLFPIILVAKQSKAPPQAKSARSGTRIRLQGLEPWTP